MEKVQRLRELLAKATPGPWFTGHLCVSDHDCNCPYIYSEHQHGMGAILTVGTTDEDVACIEEAAANQALVAEAINALPELLDGYDALAARVAELEHKVREANGRADAHEKLAESCFNDAVRFRWAAESKQFQYWLSTNSADEARAAIDAAITAAGTGGGE